MYFKKLLKKLCIFNIVTLMSCNLVPSQTIAKPIDVPVSGDATTTFPLDSSNLGPISVNPAVFTGQNVTLNITINKIDPAASKFKQAANLFAQAVDLAKDAKENSSVKQKWVDLANKFKEAAFHTAEAVFTNKDKSSTVYQKFRDAYTAANNGNVQAAEAAATASSNAAADQAGASAAKAAEAAYDAAYAANAANAIIASAYAAKAATKAANAAVYAAYAASSANVAANAAASAAAASSAAYAVASAYANNAASVNAAYAAEAAYNTATEILQDEANNYQLKSTTYKRWGTNNFEDAKTKAQAAADAIVVAEGGQDFVDVIYGDSATHDLWVRLTAKTEDDDGKPIDPTPPNASESTEWVKITNITETKNAGGTLTSITVSADMGKALMPGNYNVYVILTARETT